MPTLTFHEANHIFNQCYKALPDHLRRFSRIPLQAVEDCMARTPANAFQGSFFIEKGKLHCHSQRLINAGFPSARVVYESDKKTLMGISIFFEKTHPDWNRLSIYSNNLLNLSVFQNKHFPTERILRVLERFLTRHEFVHVQQHNEGLSLTDTLKVLTPKAEIKSLLTIFNETSLHLSQKHQLGFTGLLQKLTTPQQVEAIILWWLNELQAKKAELFQTPPYAYHQWISKNFLDELNLYKIALAEYQKRY